MASALDVYFSTLAQRIEHRPMTEMKLINDNARSPSKPERKRRNPSAESSSVRQSRWNSSSAPETFCRWQSNLNDKLCQDASQPFKRRDRAHSFPKRYWDKPPPKKPSGDNSNSIIILPNILRDLPYAMCDSDTDEDLFADLDFDLHLDDFAFSSAKRKLGMENQKESAPVGSNAGKGDAAMSIRLSNKAAKPSSTSSSSSSSSSSYIGQQSRLRI